MPTDLRQYRQRAASVFNGFTRGQKAMLALAVGGLLVGAFLFTRWAAKPTYVPLFTGLSLEDAAAVTEELSSRGVSYELAHGGTAVLVAPSEVHQLRLDLAAAGLLGQGGVPSGSGESWALLDNEGLTTSDFRQRVDYQRALQGELGRTIGTISGVETAQVHLVIPKDDLFTDDQTKPTASVLLVLEPNTSISSTQVQSIVNLVASSVEGLAPGDVSVTDAAGRLLAAPGGAAGAVTADAGLEQEQAYEQQLTRSLTATLAEVFGAGKAAVQVNADLDFDKRSTVTERFPNDPAAPIVNERTQEETYTGNDAATGGQLGANGQPTVGVENNGSYSKTDSQRTFAVTKVVEEHVQAPGTLERLSVAVMLDEAAGIDATQVAEVVSAAAGIDEARGDELVVTAVPFQRPEAGEAPDAAIVASPDSDDLLRTLRTAGTVLLVALALFLAHRSARKAAKDARTEQLTALLGPLAGGELTAGEAATPPTAALPMAAETGDQLHELIDRQPAEVARVLRTWLADRRS